MQLKEAAISIALFTVFSLSAAEPLAVSSRMLYTAMYERHGDLSSFAIKVRVNATNYEDDDHFTELAVGDGTGDVNVFFNPRDFPVRPVPGDVIEAVGQISYGAGHKRFARIRGMTVLEHGSPPEPINATLAELLGGSLDFKRVRLRATAREVVRSPLNRRWLILGVIDGKHTLAIPVLANEHDYNRLLDSVGHDITIDGFCSPADPGRLQNGRQVRLCDPSALQLSEPTPVQRAAPPIDGIENIHPSVIDVLGHHSASGTVTAVWQRQHVILREPDGRIVRVDYRKREAPQVGTVANVVGFPESNFFHISLINAFSTSEAKTDLPSSVPADVSVSDLCQEARGDKYLAYSRHGQLVQTKGKILSLPNPGNNYRMLIGEGGETLSVESEAILPVVEDLAVGSEIMLTGICVVEATAWRSIAPHHIGILLVPRFQSDARVIARASWWTPMRFVSVIGLLLAALCIILSWNLLLRKVALRKERELTRERIRNLKAETKALERTRLSVELHDSLAQDLSGVSLEVAAALQCGKGDPEALLRHLTIAAKALDSCRRSLRDSLWDLRSQALQEPALETAIRKTLLPHTKDVRIDIRFNALRSQLNERLTHDILCIIRELAINGIRHGKATAIKVAGCTDNGHLHFSVTDNGTGFDPGSCPGIADGHFGISGIRGRLFKLSGTIAFTASHAGRTRARVEIPLQGELDEGMLP